MYVFFSYGLCFFQINSKDSSSIVWEMKIPKIQFVKILKNHDAVITNHRLFDVVFSNKVEASDGSFWNITNNMQEPD